ncbi:ATP synthase F1 subunit epsilon [Membranicola marinus]|uniref:ATP synthase F1 subunit epsilon n=1 Tax=Membranihabitans marinus TaxID=1227546 RepID=A0A953HPC5_9BACT|nr:ATP synthase F1 subunit epsilon [Membranihabitans marinus]MBY5958343.1 ATP synthase F1 subunit epsilon [Membranihabitans marinus]
MLLDVITPDEKLFSGEIESVTVPGINGQFQILNNHAPIVSALTKGRVQIKKSNGEMESFLIDQGFVELLQNEVSLLVHTPKEEAESK